MDTKTKGNAHKKKKLTNLDCEEPDTIQEKTVPEPQTPLRQAEKICKIFATFIIIISATFHFYRLFRYGKIYENILFIKNNILQIFCFCLITRFFKFLSSLDCINKIIPVSSQLYHNNLSGGHHITTD